MPNLTDRDARPRLVLWLTIAAILVGIAFTAWIGAV